MIFEVHASVFPVLGQSWHDRGVVLLPVCIEIICHQKPAPQPANHDRRVREPYSDAGHGLQAERVRARRHTRCIEEIVPDVWLDCCTICALAAEVGMTRRASCCSEQGESAQQLHHPLMSSLLRRRATRRHDDDDTHDARRCATRRCAACCCCAQRGPAPGLHSVPRSGHENRAPDLAALSR